MKSNEINRRAFLKAGGTGVLVAGLGSYGLNVISRKYSDKPNILVYLPDTLRADHLGAYGYDLHEEYGNLKGPKSPSPNFDRLAEEGILFENCYSASSWTKPSFGSIFTGVYPRVHQATDNGGACVSGVQGGNGLLPIQMLKDKFITLSELLKNEGYQTGYFVSNANVKPEHGYDQGFDVNYFRDSGPNKIMRESLNWIHSIDKDKPFFALIHVIDPHEPYIPKASTFQRLFDISQKNEIYNLSEEDKKHWRLIVESTLSSSSVFPSLYGMGESGNKLLRKHYDAEIYQIDECFKQLQIGLESQGELDNTITVFTSDHGQGFGERPMSPKNLENFAEEIKERLNFILPEEEKEGHGGYTHGTTHYNEQIHVPFILRGNGLEKGKVVGENVGHVDIYSTIASLVGAEIPEYVQGKSFIDEQRKLTIPVDNVVFGDFDYNLFPRNAHNWWDGSMVKGKIKLISKDNETDFMIFNLEKDPMERDNLYIKPIGQNSEELEDLVKEYKIAREEHKKLAESFGPAEWTGMDDETKEELRALGYLG